MIKEEDSYMKVNPVEPSIPFKMRLKNTDNQINKSGVKSKVNPNFKEVKVKGNELASLPKGSVIVYDAFEPYVNKNGEHKKIGQDGHVTVALGNGKACSDVMEDEIVKTDKAYVFIPV